MPFAALARTGAAALLLIAGAILGASPAVAGRSPTSGAAYTFAGRQVFPEGLAVSGRHVYSTSFADGTIYRGEVGGHTMTPFLPGGPDGRTSAAGIRLSDHRILVAGGMTGRFFVYTSTGRLVAAYSVPDLGSPTLVNDAAVAPDGDVYVTDSFRPVVYRIPAAQVRGPVTGAQRVLTQAFALPDYVSGQSNGNGIVATPDGRYLLVGYYTSGAIYRISLDTGAVRELALDVPLTSADGMLLLGRTLLVDRAVTNVVAAVRLSSDFTVGDVRVQRGYTGVDTPTGLAVSGANLLVTNSQLDTYLYGAPLTSSTFTLGSVPLRTLVTC